MGFPTKNDHFGVWNGGTTILGNTCEVLIDCFCLAYDKRVSLWEWYIMLRLCFVFVFFDMCMYPIFRSLYIIDLQLMLMLTYWTSAFQHYILYIWYIWCQAVKPLVVTHLYFFNQTWIKLMDWCSMKVTRSNGAVAAKTVLSFSRFMYIHIFILFII